MRQIGSLENEQSAYQFTDYLLTNGVTAHAERDGDSWAIWIRDENDVQRARDEWAAFQANPNDARFQQISEEASRARQQHQRSQIEAEKNAIELRGRWKRRPDDRRVTIAVVILCAVVFVTSGVDRRTSPNLITRTLGLFDTVTSVDRTAQLREGQIWRIFTPNLMHADIVHIAFNMMWFLGFGTQIEFRQGKAFLIGLILLTGVGTMGAELLLSDGNPIGMSGVVYGLFAYILMRSRLDPRSNYVISDQTVLILMLFFFISWSGLLGSNIANWGHTGGLVVGLVCGYIPTLFRRR